MSLWDKITTQNEIDSALIRNLSDISYKSSKGRRENGRSLKDGIVNLGTLPFQEIPPPTAITKEMILDYHKSLTAPLKDPITGLEIKEKYYPSTFAYDISDVTTPPTLINEATLGNPANKLDYEKYNKLLIDGVKQIKLLGKDKKDAEERLLEVKTILNEGMPGTDADGNPIRLPISPTEEAALKTDYAKIEKDLQDLNLEYTKLYSLNGNYKKIKESIAQNIIDNENVLIQHNKNIKDSINKYKESLLTQNANRVIIEEQRPNETQEQYLQRMKDMEAEQFDMNLFNGKAELHQIVMLKKNLRQIFSNDGTIENVIKSFKPDQRFIINKHFAEIREYFLETYGKNNTNLSLEDVVEIITRHLERILNPSIEYKIQDDETPAATAITSPIQVLDSDVIDATTSKPIPTDFKFGVDKNSLYIENDKEGSHVYFKIAETQDGKELLLYSTDTNEAGKFNQVMERETTGTNRDDVLKNIITKHLKIDDFAKNKILNKTATSKVNNLIELLKTNYKLEPIKKGLQEKKMISGLKKLKRFGAGLKDPEQELPEYAFFGEIVVMLSKLYYNNILSVRTKSGRAIDGFRNAKVSNFFVDIIMEMYANKNVSNSIKDLSVDEKNLMNSLLFQAKLHKKYTTDTNETLSQLKEKHKVIEGEILAGNDNPQLLKDLKDVLMKLYHFKAISIPAINKYLKNFE